MSTYRGLRITFRLTWEERDRFAKVAGTWAGEKVNWSRLIRKALEHYYSFKMKEEARIVSDNLDRHFKETAPIPVVTLEQAAADPAAFVDGMVETSQTNHELPTKFRKSDKTPKGKVSNGKPAKPATVRPARRRQKAARNGKPRKK